MKICKNSFEKLNLRKYYTFSCTAHRTFYGLNDPQGIVNFESRVFNKLSKFPLME